MAILIVNENITLRSDLMKKFLYLFSILVITFSIIGCSKAADPEEANIGMVEEAEQGEILTIMDYYPFEENKIMAYEGIGNEYAEQTSMVEYIDENKIQIKIVNPGTTFVKVLEYNNGELKEVFREGEFYHIENMLNANRNSDNIILKEPLEVGTAWTNSQGDPIEITSLDKEIETFDGKHKALEVTKKFENGSIEKVYYGRNIGLIGTVYRDGDFEVKTILKSIENQGQKIKIEAYYPVSDDINTNYLEKSIVFNTNDHIENILENILKNPDSSKLLAPISKDTKINMIDLDRNTWTLKVDFSEELLEDMNAGSSYEFEIIKSIVNTLGRFYDVEKVYITVNGANYESGHISMGEGEHFQVNTEDIEKKKE